MTNRVLGDGAACDCKGGCEVCSSKKSASKKSTASTSTTTSKEDSK